MDIVSLEDVLGKKSDLHPEVVKKLEFLERGPISPTSQIRVQEVGIIDENTVIALTRDSSSSSVGGIARESSIYVCHADGEYRHRGKRYRDASSSKYDKPQYRMDNLMDVHVTQEGGVRIVEVETTWGVKKFELPLTDLKAEE